MGTICCDKKAMDKKRQLVSDGTGNTEGVGIACGNGGVSGDYHRKRMYGYWLNMRYDCPKGDFVRYCCQFISENSGKYRRVNQSAAARVYKFCYDGEDFYYKYFLKRNVWDIIKTFCVGSRADKSLRGDICLEKHGFCSTTTILTGSKLATSFTVTRAVKGKNLRKYLHGRFNKPFTADQARQRKAVIKALGGVIGKMHSNGIVHGDLRQGNIFVDDSVGTDLPRFIFLDNERTRKYKRLSINKRVKNLVQLHMLDDGIVTCTDRMRFFREYIAVNSDIITDVRGLLMLVVQEAQKRKLKKPGWKLGE